MRETWFYKTLQLLKQEHSDINEHLQTLYRYASEVDTIVELGVRTGRSTIALLTAHPVWMKSYDKRRHDANVSKIEDEADAEGIDFSFTLGSSFEVDPPERDLLFIDTKHDYETLSKELRLHGNKTKKYIIMHDTSTFPGLNKAIEEFLAQHLHWRLAQRFTNNNGLTILERNQ